jgi:hypothetical protein
VRSSVYSSNFFFFKEKVHFITLIYRPYLIFNLQPQNQALDGQELLKPSDLTHTPPRWNFGWFSHKWRHVEVVFAYVAPHQRFLLSPQWGPHAIFPFNLLPATHCRRAAMAWRLSPGPSASAAPWAPSNYH